MMTIEELQKRQEELLERLRLQQQEQQEKEKQHAWEKGANDGI